MIINFSFVANLFLFLEAEGSDASPPPIMSVAHHIHFSKPFVVIEFTFL